MKDFYTLDKSDTRAYWMAENGKRYTTHYECMECGANFYGTWHSKYSKSKVICPVCQHETDDLFIIDKCVICME